MLKMFSMLTVQTQDVKDAKDNLMVAKISQSHQANQHRSDDPKYNCKVGDLVNSRYAEPSKRTQIKRGKTCGKIYAAIRRSIYCHRRAHGEIQSHYRRPYTAKCIPVISHITHQTVHEERRSEIPLTNLTRTRTYHG